MDLAGFYTDNQQITSQSMCPRRVCDVGMTELARYVRVGKKQGRGFVEIVQIRQPKKNTTIFDKTLYPDCASETPALTAKKWFSGDTSDPVLRDIRN